MKKIIPTKIPPYKMLILSYILVALLLLALIFLGKSFRIPFEYVSNNPESQFGVPLYAGFLQKIRVIIWASTMSVCFFSYYSLKAYASNNENIKFIFYSGILTGLLLLDDYFQLHLAARFILHLPNIFVYSIYALFAFYIFFRFKKIILESDYLILFLAFLFLGVAIILDLLSDGKIIVIGKEDEIEATSKILGVASWSVYFITLCYDYLRVIILQKL